MLVIAPNASGDLNINYSLFYEISRLECKKYIREIPLFISNFLSSYSVAYTGYHAM